MHCTDSTLINFGVVKVYYIIFYLWDRRHPYRFCYSFPIIVICFPNLLVQWYSITRLVAVPSLMRVILPTFQSRRNRRVQDSLKLLVLSGEILHLSLWNMLTELLPRTAILNLYGSTEVRHSIFFWMCKSNIFKDRW